MARASRTSTVERRAAALARVLDAHRTVDRTLALSRDPVQFPRRYGAREDREVAALLSALLAFGRVETIRTKLESVFARLGPSPARSARECSTAELLGAFRGFRHRTFTGEDIARLVAGAGELLRRDGSVFAVLTRTFTTTGSLRDALAAFVDEMRAHAFGATLSRSARHLLPDPRGASACKRLALLSRWIARPDDGVDLGLGVLPTHALIIPLDVHLHRVARRLGFTHRKSASWLAAEEVTAALRQIDVNDPVRFDFALCHVEIDAHRRRREGV